MAIERPVDLVLTIMPMISKPFVEFCLYIYQSILTCLPGQCLEKSPRRKETWDLLPKVKNKEKKTKSDSSCTFSPITLQSLDTLSPIKEKTSCHFLEALLEAPAVFL